MIDWDAVLGDGMTETLGEDPEGVIREALVAHTEAKKMPFRLALVDPDKLDGHPQNFRRHPESQAAGLEALMRELKKLDPEGSTSGHWAGALLYNERTERFIDGHLRKEIPQELRIEGMVPAFIGSWTEEQESLLLATFDAIGAMAEPDEERLVELLSGIETEDEEVRALLDRIAVDAEGPPIDPDPPEEFPEVDESITVDHECPKCGYQWSGSTKPRTE